MGRNKNRLSKKLEKPWAAYTFAVCCGVVLYLFLEHINLLGRGLAGLYHIIRPVFIGLVLAYVTYPLVRFFESHLFRNMKHPKTARGISIAITYIIIIAVIVLFLVSDPPAGLQRAAVSVQHRHVQRPDQQLHGDAERFRSPA